MPTTTTRPTGQHRRRELSILPRVIFDDTGRRSPEPTRDKARLRVAEQIALQGVDLRRIADAVGFGSLTTLAVLARRHRRPDLAARWTVPAGRPCAGCTVGLSVREVWTVDTHGVWCRWCWRMIRCKTCGAPRTTITDRGQAYYLCVDCDTRRLAA
jgi:hypothetical protein